MKRKLHRFKKSYFLIVTLVMLGFNVNAQRYDFSASSGTFVPLTNSVAVDAIEGDDYLSDIIPIGFTFNYFGTDYTSFKVSSNGFITFDISESSSYFNNSNPSSQRIAPLWDDLGGAGGEASYELTGTTPNRVFTFEWLNWKWRYLASQGGISFQVRLHENGTIEFVYRQETGSLYDPSASIAIVGDNSDQFYALSNSQATATLSANWISNINSKPASGQTYTFTPNSEAIAAPSTQASEILADLGTNNANLSWTNGNGEYRVVFMKETATAETTAPVNNHTYTANSNFANGEYIMGGWYCVYNGTGNQVSVTGLESGVSYSAQVFEYNGLAELQQYNATSSTNNPVGITAILAAPTGSISTIHPKHKTSSEITFELYEGHGDHRAVFIKAGVSGTSLPTDNTTYEANSIYGTGSQIGTSGWYCVFNGNPAGDLTITGLSANTDYMIHVVDYNGPEGSERYHISSDTDNPVHFKSYIPSTGTYSFEASSGTFAPISDSTAVDYIENNYRLSDNIPIGFTFYFGDNSFTELKASSKGWLTFNLYEDSYNSINDLTSSYASPVLAPLWDDLSGSGGQASYNTTGTAPNRVFTMEFLNWKWDYNASPAGISFQVKLYETSGKIEYIYRQEAGALYYPSASIGISFPDMGSGNFLSLSDASASPTVSSTVETNSISTKPATGQIYTFNLNKHNQTITFDVIPDKTIGDEPFIANAVSSSGLPVSLSSSSDKITISGKEITLVKAGSVTITANQGGASYYSAPPVDRTFCINPVKPVISATGLNSSEVVLTSNTTSGNQWYKNGKAINGATDVTYKAVENGIYTLTCAVDNCVSEESDGQNYTTGTTGIDNTQSASIMVYPNPVENILTITLPGDKMTPVAIVNMNGETIKKVADQGTIRLDVSALKSGNYIVLIYAETGLITKKINKL